MPSSEPPTASDHDILLVDHPAEGVVRARLNRPAQRGALDLALTHALIGFFSTTQARAIVLGSANSHVFCAGADLSIDESERAAVSERLYALYELMVTCPAPIVAAIEGAAVGGGTQLALAGDLRIGGPDARLRVVGPGHGLAVGMWALPGLVGRGRALDYALTNRWVPAREALDAGLLSEVSEACMDTSVAVAARIAGLDTGAVARIKQAAASPDLVRRLRSERDGNTDWHGAAEGGSR